jgi:hypothetical protein
MSGFVLPGLGLAALAGAAGFGFGLAYFAALGRNVALYLEGGGLAAATGLTLARLAAAVAAFAFAARLGALPLLATLLGFLVARFVALNARRRAG